MSNIRKLKVERIIDRLKEVRDTSTMKNAHFENVGAIKSNDYPKLEKEVNKFIKDRTKGWRDSWIIEPLDNIIKILEEEIRR